MVNKAFAVFLPLIAIGLGILTGYFTSLEILGMIVLGGSTTYLIFQNYRILLTITTFAISAGMILVFPHYPLVALVYLISLPFLAYFTYSSLLKNNKKNA
jgi:hypothetical protein